MGRSKATQRRRRQEKEQPELVKEKPQEAARPCEANTEALFRLGETLTRVEIEERITQSKLVRRADDEYFRLMKARFFKRHDGSLIVRGAH